jgi:hypothetical protein
MKIPANRHITTSDLRASYKRNDFSFGNPDSFFVLCLIGSCRILPILDYFRAYNSLHGEPFNLLCFDPVEMWNGPGTDIGEIVTEKLKDFRFGHVDVLICESLITCGALNTVDTQPLNVFSTLGCSPETILRIPNWHGMRFYNREVEAVNPAFAAMSREERVGTLRTLMSLYKTKFLNRCLKSSFPELAQWADDNWLTTRLGSGAEHVSGALSWRFFEHIATAMGIPITQSLKDHPFCARGYFDNSDTILDDIDREANNWKF